MSNATARAFAPYLAFSAFGIFWGTWGASLPVLRQQAGVDDAELGVALLFVGAGALPAMAGAGRLIDRRGPRVSAILLVVLAIAGCGVGVFARDFVTLAAGMTLVGAASGAADVAINTVAAHAENASDAPILTRSHGLFSVAVVASTLGTGALLAVWDSGDTCAAFLVSGSLIGVAAAFVWSGTTFRPTVTDGVGHVDSSRPRTSAGSLLPLLAVGIVGALAYAIENAYQSWGGVFVVDFYSVGPAVASFAPATFAAIAAIARLTLAPLSRSSPRALLVAGGASAALGSFMLASSTSPGMAFAGIALAALGTATMFPTLLSQATRDIPPDRRGSVTSLVATVAYVGFLLGPACMGFLAASVTLRGAFIAVAAAGVGFAAIAWLVSAWARARLTEHGQLANDRLGRLEA